MKHQRVRKVGEEDSGAHHIRGVFQTEPAQKYRKGACENCGSMTHKRKDCLERPRKIGVKYDPRDIQPDEFVQEADLSFDGKRDRWAGYDPEEFSEVIETFESVEAERRRLKEAEIEERHRTKLENGVADSASSLSCDSDFDSDSSSLSKEEDSKYAESADMPGQKLDTKGRMTVRNLRLREDTAKYLRNLDPNSAYYDPKTRSMRDNPHPDAEDPSLLPFAGDNFVRQSGEALMIPELQVFAWQTADRGLDVNLQANPSQLEKMHKDHVARKSEEARQREKVLAEAYGATNGSSSEESDVDPLLDTL